jgi:formyltetrahydrofolate deformylase
VAVLLWLCPDKKGIRKGRDPERLVLARGVRLHSEDRILVHGRKTVVFD